MAVIDLYASSVSWYEEAEGEVAENGDFTQGEGSWSEAIECEAVPSSGQASEREFEDGVTRKYSFVLHLHPSCRTFTIGEQVKLTRHDLTYQLAVAGFMRYQHQAKVWIG